MQATRNAMPHIVEPGRGALPDAAGVEAVAAAPGEPRGKRRFEQALRVDDLVIAALAQRAQDNARSRARCAAPRCLRRHLRHATGMTSETAGCRATSGANASSTAQENRASGRARRASVSAGI